jgi:hypothetical protein
MASTIAKCVSAGFASFGTDPQHSGGQDPRYYSGAYPGVPDNMHFGYDTLTPWVKVWVEVAQLWPGADVQHQYVDQSLLTSLDNQIAAARVYGFKVVLTFTNKWPKWVNDSDNPLARPKDLSSNGWWFFVVSQLAARYSAWNTNRPVNGWARVEVLELMNEPNTTGWVNNPSGDGYDSHTAVAVMLKRGKQIVGVLGNAPLIAGPAVLDLATGPSHSEDYANWTAGIIAAMLNIDFFGTRDSLGNLNNFTCVWTVHNYGDVLHDCGVTTQSTTPAPLVGDPYRDYHYTRTSGVWNILDGAPWRGFPSGQPDGNFSIFTTEGGAQQELIPGAWGLVNPSQPTLDWYQAVLVARNMDRMKTDTEGRKVGLLSNYLWYSAQGFDTGLQTYNFPPPGSVPPPPPNRLAYNSWKSEIRSANLPICDANTPPNCYS